MSLRDKAREVKEAGVAERGNFTPTGVPKRIYQWWLSESNSKKARAIRHGKRRENFCHFWRVVLFWAPLRKFVQGFNDIAPFFAVLAAIAAVVGFIWACFVAPIIILQVAAFMLLMTLLVGGVVAGISMALIPVQRRGGWIEDRRFIALFFILGLPAAIPVYLGVRFGRFYLENLTDYNKQIWFSVLGVVLTAIVLLTGTLGSWWLVMCVTLGILVFIVGIVAAVFLLVQLSDYIDGRRAIAKRKATEARAVYIAEHGELPVRQPGRVEKFFSGLGDFIVLIAQVVRVNKWKICPIVEID